MQNRGILSKWQWKETRNRNDYDKSIYDVDRGAEPDYVLTSPEKFYDRTALTEYINSLT